MTESSHDHDADHERRLAAWLREAGSAELHDAAGPVAKTRAALLEQLDSTGASAADAVASRSGWNRLWRGLARHRAAVGGVAASTLLAVSLLFAALHSGTPLSAMERMVQELCAITSYSYRLHTRNEWKDDGGRLKVMVESDGMAYWQSPDAFRNEMTIDRYEQQLPDGKRTKKVLEHFAEIFPLSKKGLLIDYLRKTYVRIPFEPTGSKTYPWDVLRMVREESYDVDRELVRDASATSTPAGTC